MAFLAVAAIVQNAWYWNWLPERVATHFNFEGTPDSWMSKRNATIVMCGFQLGMPLFILAMISLASRLPVSLVNIPHREYWLHPDRRQASLNYFKNQMLWIAVIVSLLTMAVNHLTFIANRDGNGLKSGWFGLLMIAFLTAIFTIVCKMVMHFRLPGNRHSGH
jgi:uncharacterized membrane protein